MTSYKPHAPFSTALLLLIPERIETNYAVGKYVYPRTAEGRPFFGSFKTYGGTETTVNGLYAVEDTATIETWYNPDIYSDCRIAIAGTSKVYEVVGEPENVDQRNQYMTIKVKRLRGKP